jgi:phenylalanyl-tRNA synthetase beta chain
MRVSYNWLKEYVKFNLSPEELAEELTMVGLEVEEVIPRYPKFEGIVVGRVLSVDRHPNADKLSLCRVETGNGQLEVICGASNVSEGQTIPFAPIGTKLPNGLVIKKAKIRGVESSGMICSEEELGLVEHSDGIWELSSELKIGQDLYKHLEKNQDYILDISITPNRPDAMSMIGVARDVAAILDEKLVKPIFKLSETDEKSDDVISVKIENPDGCPRYAARVIRNVKMGESPNWMAEKLLAGGFRPINIIVDITNFVLLELGQPLHAFDLLQIAGNKIVVRDSKKEEKFTTLDNKDRQMPKNTVMICDAEKAVAIGGIMGGLNSEVSEKTTDILLESAYFTPERIGVSSKKLGLPSEASQRFERGVDPNGIPFACDRAASLMAELAGGEILKGIVDEYPDPFKPLKINIRLERINHLLGTELTDKDISSIFTRLEIIYKNGEALIPTFRPDIEREVDLIEEVARLINFDNIPVKIQTNIEYDATQNKNESFFQFLKSEIREQGYYEVLTNSMVALRELESIDDNQYVKILNPISDDMNVMRRSLIPGLLRIVAYNLNRNVYDMRIFEMGRVFHSSDTEASESQPYYLSGIIHGSRRSAGWSEKPSTVDFYDIKGSVQSYLNKIFLDNIEFILYDKNIYFDSDQVIAIRIKNQNLGHFGRINPEITKKFDIDSDVYGFEFSINAFKNHINLNQLFEMYSRFPFVEKDLALIVTDDVKAAELENLIYKIGNPLVKKVDVFDLYMGKHLGENKKSIAFRIRFQSSERTLNEKEVSKIFNKIISDAGRTYNATLREST